MKYRNRAASGALGAGLTIIGMWVVCIAAWITHIVVCLSSGLWGFLIAGALVFPVAIIHGIGYWFGFFH